MGFENIDEKATNCCYAECVLQTLRVLKHYIKNNFFLAFCAKCCIFTCETAIDDWVKLLQIYSVKIQNKNWFPKEANKVQNHWIVLFHS